MSWLDYMPYVMDIVNGLADNSSYKKTKNAGLRRDDVEWLIQQDLNANRVGHNTPFMSHQWDEDKTTMNSGFADTELGRMLQGQIADSFDALNNRQPMAVPHQFGSIQDGLLANKMYRMGILDDESMPNLKQDNYGMRVGDQDRSAYGLDSLTGEEEEDSNLDSILADTVEDEFGNTGTGSRGAGEGGVIDPTAPGSGTDLGGGRDWMDFYRNQNPGGMGGNSPGINEILDGLVSSGQISESDRGTWAEFLLSQNGGTIGSTAGSLIGGPTGSLIGKAIGKWLGDKNLGSKVWMSDGKYGGKYDAWKGEGPNPGPVDPGNSLMPENSMPGDQGMLDNAINDYIGSAPAPGNADFYQGGRFNGGAGGTDGGGGMSAGGWGNGIGSAGGLGGGMGGGFGGGFGGMTGNIVGSSWRGTPTDTSGSGTGGGWFKDMQDFVKNSS